MTTESDIKRFFDSAPVSSTIQHVARAVGCATNLKVVGGSLRELVLQSLLGVSPIIPDLDIAILSDVHDFDVLNKLGERECVPNTFGGIRWRGVSGIEVDLWTTRSWSSALGKPEKLHYADSDILEMLDFSLNAGLYDPASHTSSVGEIVRAVESHCLELNNSLVPPHALQLARILKLERRLQGLSFSWGPKLTGYVANVVHLLHDSDFEASRNYFIKKIGHTNPDAASYFDVRISEICRMGRNASTKTMIF